MNRDTWNFSVWQQWNHKVYVKSLTSANIVGKGAENFYEELFYIVDNVLEEKDLEADHRSFYFFAKNGKEYLLPKKFMSHLPVQPLPGQVQRVQLKKSDKKVYHLILDCQRVTIPVTEPTKTFREHIDAFNPMEHSKPDSWFLLKCIAYASLYKGIKMGICSPPALGKNANHTLLNQIFENIARVEVPTPAQFYHLLTHNDVIVFDEFTSGDNAKIKLIMNSVLMVGDDSPEFIKQSMTVGSQQDTIDLTQKSILFTFQRPQDLKNPTKHFESKFTNPTAFKSRYPLFLMEGEVLTTMSKLSPGQARELMEPNFKEMAEFAKEIQYWINNLHKHLNGYDRSKYQLKGRHLSNTEGLLDVLDVACQDQAEYNHYLELLNRMFDNYKKMMNNLGKGEPVKVTSVKLGGKDYSEEIDEDIL